MHLGLLLLRLRSKSGWHQRRGATLAGPSCCARRPGLGGAQPRWPPAPSPTYTWVPARPLGSHSDVSAELPFKAPPACCSVCWSHCRRVQATLLLLARRPPSCTSGTVGPHDARTRDPYPGWRCRVFRFGHAWATVLWGTEQAAPPSLGRLDRCEEKDQGVAGLKVGNHRTGAREPSET